MNDAAIVAAYEELASEARHKEMWIEVDEYRHEFRVLDFSQKPAVQVGTCTTIDELVSILHDCWKDEMGKWVYKGKPEE